MAEKKAEGNICASLLADRYSLLLLWRLKARPNQTPRPQRRTTRNAVSHRVFWATFHEEKSQSSPNLFNHEAAFEFDGTVEYEVFGCGVFVFAEVTYAFELVGYAYGCIHE